MGYCYSTKVTQIVVYVSVSNTDITRLIMIELRDRVSRPTADFPTDVSPLPSSLKPDPTSRECVFQFSEQLLNSAESGSHIDWIARQAQAVRLFDQILQVINYQTDEELKIVELTKIDTKLQSFLKFLMNESGFEDWKIRSAVTATVLRYNPENYVSQAYKLTDSGLSSLCMRKY